MPIAHSPWGRSKKTQLPLWRPEQLWPSCFPVAVRQGGGGGLALITRRGQAAGQPRAWRCRSAIREEAEALGGPSAKAPHLLVPTSKDTAAWHWGPGAFESRRGAKLLFASDMPTHTHTRKQRGAARIICFKTSQYFVFSQTAAEG
jgi:hypothetical protein